MSYGYPQQQAAWPAYGYGNAYPSRRSAPVSVHIVATVQYLGGLAALAVGALFGYVAVNLNRLPAGPTYDVFRDGSGSRLLWATAIGFGVSGLIAIVLGRKLQRGRNWARVLLNLLNLLTVASVLYVDLKSLHDGRSLAGLILPVLCLILLNTRAARSWFRSRTY